MKSGLLGGRFGVVAGAMVALCLSGTYSDAKPRSAAHGSSRGHGSSYSSARSHGRAWHASWQRSSALQCVPFARENSGIELSGNAGTWWNSAEGVYERGARPEVGSILNFRSTSHMRMGHVAVVANVISPRHIEIDHANWGAPGRVSRNIDVVDVSPNNDWTAVRVALNAGEDYGSTYPTYGFIYDRPDHGTMVANDSRAPLPAMNAEPTVQQAAAAIDAPEEVAEAADDDDAAPHYSARHRRYARSSSTAHSSTLHASAAAPRGRSSSTPSTVRVSTHATSKPVSTHKTGRRRL